MGLYGVVDRQVYSQGSLVELSLVLVGLGEVKLLWAIQRR